MLWSAAAPARAEATEPLVYTEIANSSADGPLVGGISSAQALAYALTDPAKLLDYVNPQLLSAGNRLPHGSRLEFVITGWMVAGSSLAQYVASRLNGAYAAGRLVNPQTGTALEAWPEYPGQVAWGDDATDAVTLRVLASPWAYVLVGALALVAAAVVWDLLSHAGWTASSVGLGSAVSPIGVISWLIAHWYVPVGIVVAGIAAPIIINEVASTREAENRLEYAEGGGT